MAKAKRAPKGGVSINWDDERGVYVASRANPSEHGGRRLKAYSANYDAALEKLEKLYDLARKGIDPSITRAPTVKAWLERYLEDQTTRRSHATSRGDKSKINCHVIPRIGHIKLRELTGRDLNKMYDEIIRDISKGGRFSGVASAQAIERILSAAFNKAVNEGIIDRNPVKNAEAPTKVVVERRAMSADQGMMLLSAAYKANHEFTAPLAIMLFTGVRIGEAIGVAWDKVKLSNKLDGTGGTIDASWQLQSVTRVHGCGAQDPETKKWPCGIKLGGWCPQVTDRLPPGMEYNHVQGALYLSRPKSSASIRKLPMTPQLNWILTWQAQKTHGLIDNEHGFVALNSSARHERRRSVRRREEPIGPIPPRHAHTLFKECLALAGLPEDIKPHETRHTTSTLLLNAGVDPKVIQMILGHTSIATTEIYMHINQALAATALGELDNLMTLGLPGPSVALAS